MKLTEEFKKQLTARLEELKPAVEEYREIERLLAAIRDADVSKPSPARAPRRTTSRARSRATAGSKGTRAEHALRLVGERPGITVAELSEAMGIGTTYLYRVLPALEKEGRVRKVGKGYEPAA